MSVVHSYRIITKNKECERREEEAERLARQEAGGGDAPSAPRLVTGRRLQRPLLGSSRLRVIGGKSAWCPPPPPLHRLLKTTDPSPCRSLTPSHRFPSPAPAPPLGSTPLPLPLPPAPCPYPCAARSPKSPASAPTPPYRRPLPDLAHTPRHQSLPRASPSSWEPRPRASPSRKRPRSIPAWSASRAPRRPPHLRPRSSPGYVTPPSGPGRWD